MMRWRMETRVIEDSLGLLHCMAFLEGLSDILNVV
jgi:hypothetical protein